MPGSTEKHFQEQYQCGASVGSILWDISAMKQAIDQGVYPIRAYDVQTLMDENPSPIDKEYAMTTDPTRPGILAQLSGDTWKLLDGNHRLYKASVLGAKTFRCYVLYTEDHLRYVVDLDLDKYFAICRGYATREGYGLGGYLDCPQVADNV